MILIINSLRFRHSVDNIRDVNVYLVNKLVISECDFSAIPYVPSVMISKDLISVHLLRKKCIDSPNTEVSRNSVQEKFA